MEAIVTHTGRMAPLLRPNIDTDQIIPQRFLKRIERAGFGRFLFADWAEDEEGEPIASFVLNRPEYRQASVLITGRNFGSGSSREHAPWSLQDRGFRVIIAPSFADIFRANCCKIGLLAVELAPDQVEALAALAEDDPAAIVTVDLEAQTVSAPGVDADFNIDPFVKHSLINGIDGIAATLERAHMITEYEELRPGFRPSLRGSGATNNGERHG